MHFNSIFLQIVSGKTNKRASQFILVDVLLLQ